MKEIERIKEEHKEQKIDQKIIYERYQKLKEKIQRKKKEIK